MPFKPGQSGNPAGKTKGTTNKIGAEHRDYLRGLLLENKERFEETLKKMDEKDFMRTYLALMQYTLPKPTTIQIKEVPKLSEFIAMTPEERKAVIDEIQEEQRNEIQPE